ncbi:MAG: J domain-containing protein [Kaiparowitsia implicata GSE-PSE-MK54-09C]|jgi:hypothetical protein|nr:J domain-containing protein [Kaiparowitsia implicata GSE-PSE-MK54-09C]
MKSKTLKASYTLTASTLDEAIAQLSGLYLRATKTTCRVVKQATGFPLINLCKPLIDDWRSGKQPYHPGEITLSFGGELDLEADLLVYAPLVGDGSEGSPPTVPDRSSTDRLLYSRKTQRPLGQLSLPIEDDMVVQMAKQLRVLADTLTQLTESQRAMEARLGSLADLGRQASAARPAGSSASAPAASEATTGAARSSTGGPDTGAIAKHMRELLEAQTNLMTQMIARQVQAAVEPLAERLEALQAQMERAIALGNADDGSADIPDIPAPKTEAEWRQRIQDTWGTVGDYEQYSASYRDANAETPLFETPDWVALCELDWARQLCPVLGALHTLIHASDGIGYSGADVLQQFGQHLDPRTGDRYYIYTLGGVSAAEAMAQMVSHPQQSWLPELKALSAIAPRFPDVFKLFGWEKEAIAALDQIISQAQQERQSGQRSYSSQQGQHTSQQSGQHSTRAGTSLGDHLAILNIGPFTPISMESLKQAYRQAMKTAHPDAGGSKERAQRVNEAYEAVLRHYFSTPH